MFNLNIILLEISVSGLHKLLSSFFLCVQHVIFSRFVSLWICTFIYGTYSYVRGGVWRSSSKEEGKHFYLVLVLNFKEQSRIRCNNNEKVNFSYDREKFILA